MPAEREGELDKVLMLNALTEIGRRCETGCELVIVGAAAAVLCDWLQCGTTDIDVLVALPRLALFDSAINALAEQLGLGAQWLNDAAKACSEVPPAEYVSRLKEQGGFGRLKVFVIGRADFILLKLYARRATDVQDLRALQPRIAQDELDCVRRQLPRIARFNPVQAHRIGLFLDAEG